MHLHSRGLRWLALACLCAAAPVSGEADLHVAHAWARATPPTAHVGAAYLVIHNLSDGADRLLGARSPVAKRAELHTTMMEGGVMQMLKLEEVTVEPGEHLELEPGGHHIMLMDLEAPLREGETFPLTLEFEKAGDIEVGVLVKGVDAEAEEMRHEHHEHAGTHTHGSAE